MKKLLIGLAAAAAVAIAPTAQANAYDPGYQLNWYEYAPLSSVTFTPACAPAGPTCDPRGPGSWFASSALLTNGSGVAVGQVHVRCDTTHSVARLDLGTVSTPFGTFPARDYYGDCLNSIFVGGEYIIAKGNINETGLERYEPQTTKVVAVSPGFRSPVDLLESQAYLKVQQVAFPDRFELSILTPYTADGQIPGY